MTTQTPTPYELLDRFCTPPARTPEQMQPRYPRNADSLMLLFDGGEAHGFALGPEDGPKVVLMHGWGSRALEWLAVARPLASAGCRVFAYDGPAHGATPGDRATMPLFARFLVEVCRQHGEFDLAVGHSLGAASLLLAATNHPAAEADDDFRAKRLAVLSCPDNLGDMFEVFLRDNELPQSLSPVMQAELDRLFPSHDGFAISRVVEGLRHGELFMMHDRDDETVPYDRAERIAAAARGAIGSEHVQLVATDNLGHGGVLRNRDVARLLLEYIGALE